MITPNQITITSDVAYELQGLTIPYFAENAAGILILSNEQVMDLMHEISYVVDKKNARIETAYGWTDLSQYMDKHLDNDLAKCIVAEYLNTSTDKSGNYKTTIL